MTILNRRQAMTAAIASPLAAAIPAAGFAAADMMGASAPQSFKRFTVGGFEVTTLLGGTMTRDNAQGIFGTNVTPEEFAEVSEENFIPTDKAQFFFTPVLVNTGSELVLFDTGLNAEATGAAITAAGYAPEQVDKVVITHMHGDHIGGLMNGEAAAYGNAAHIAGATEDNFWSAAENDTYEGRVRPLREQFSFVEPGASVAPGITSVAAPGHTPGHMGYMVESDGAQLMLFADLANHYVWSLGYPDWEVSFDMDKATAAASRREVLSMLAADKIPSVGYHMPFPALGYVEPRGDGFRWVPSSYQTMIG